MEISLVQYIDKKIIEKSKIVNEYSNELKIYFEPKNYGDSLEKLYFGIISVSKEFKKFFKPRKPKFTKSNKMFEYDFDRFKNTEDSNLKSFILEGILESLQVISEKVKDFDINAFEQDLKQLV